MKEAYQLVLLVGLVFGCSGTTVDNAGGTGGASGTIGSIGARCDSVQDCEVPQTCKSDFPYERKVCTLECSGDDDCPADAACVSDLSDYNDQAFDAAFCLVPCVTDADCPGSSCDDRAAGARFCF